jgi:hypothetical protein
MMTRSMFSTLPAEYVAPPVPNAGDIERAAIRLASKATSAAVERLAEADRRHAATTSQWDADPGSLTHQQAPLIFALGKSTSTVAMSTSRRLQ